MMKQITQEEALSGRTIERIAHLGWGTAVILDNDEFFIIGINQDYPGEDYYTHIVGELRNVDISRTLLDAGIVTEEEYVAEEAAMAQRQEQARLEQEQAQAAIQERDRIFRQARSH